MTAPAEQPFSFSGGYPTPETVGRAYDDVDLNRAIQMYRFFYRSVSGAAIFTGTEQVGVRANKVFGYMDTTQARRLHAELGHSLRRSAIGFEHRSDGDRASTGATDRRRVGHPSTLDP
jgi:hypothetical protein